MPKEGQLACGADVRRWWKCELINLALIFRGGAIAPAIQRSTELALNQ
jgi:hypothetical protein